MENENTNLDKLEDKKSFSTKFQNWIKNKKSKAIIIIISAVSIIAVIVAIAVALHLTPQERTSVDKVVDCISDIGEVTPESYDKISEARRLYDNLTTKQQIFVSNKNLLKDAETQLFSIQISHTISLIDKIGTVTLASESAICDAENYFNQLTEEQKEKVTNADKLSAAKDKFDSLLCEDCISKINNIGTVTLGKEQAIVDAETCYSKLSDDSKKKITNHNVLVDARAKFSKLKKEAEEKAKTLSPRDSFKNSSWEITYQKTSLVTRITPDVRDGAYLYYGCDNDEIIVDAVFKIKNISADELKIDGIVDNVVVTYKDKYTYNDFRAYYSTADDIDAVYDWDTIDPLKTATLHIGMWIPRTAKTEGGSLKVKLDVLGQEKIIVVK